MPIREADYAADKIGRRHRISAFVVFTVFIGLASYSKGPEQALKTLMGLLLPLACICFPAVMANYKTGKGGRLSPSHPKALRWAGWFLLLGVPTYILLLSGLLR